MTSDRDRILTQIRQGLTSAHLPAAQPSLPPPTAQPAIKDADLVDSFIREAEALGVKVHQPKTSTAFNDLVVGLAAADGNRELLAWDDARLPGGLGDALRSAGFDILDPNLPAEAVARRTKLIDLGRATVGITGALAGLADSGSLALVNGPGRSRLASLLPPIHVALLRASTILPDLSTFFTTYPTVTQSGSNLVFITGPSRTADIEMTLVVGVHGPKQVQVVLVPD